MAAAVVGILCISSGCASMGGNRTYAETENPFLNNDQVVSVSGQNDPLEVEEEKGSFFKAPWSKSDKQQQEQQRKEAKEVERGVAEFQQAERHYKAQEYDKAEELFRRVAKRYETDEYGLRKRSIGGLFSGKERTPHYIDSPLREDALYYLAESHFHQEELPAAETAYLQLLNDYASTRYLPQSTRRLFQIAAFWMDIDVIKSEDLQQASYTDEGQRSQIKFVKREGAKDGDGSFFHFFDKRFPTTDSNGRALEALKGIWMHDPLGELADDALMLTATHQLRTGDYLSAGETLKLLREQYPDSEHLKDAFILGSHVRQVSYQGSDYDGKSLKEAVQLSTSALEIFPDLSAEQRERLQNELVHLKDAEVRRELDRAKFYLKKRKFDAVVIYCNHILQKYPDSSHAAEARALLRQMGKYRDGNSLWLAIRDESEQTAPPAEEKEDSNGLRRAFKMPELKSISIPGFGSDDEESEADQEPPAATPTQNVTPASASATNSPGRVRLTRP